MKSKIRFFMKTNSEISIYSKFCIKYFDILKRFKVKICNKRSTIFLKIELETVKLL